MVSSFGGRDSLCYKENIVISVSEREAIDLVEKECNEQETLEWKVQKIEIATGDYYGPIIIMKNV
jgi:hypothetical protein